jgi:hypothetical protein
MTKYIQIKNYLLMLLFMLFISCNSSYKLILKVEGSIEGISVESNVILLDSVVGKVKDISFDNNLKHFLVHLGINRDIRISKDAKFAVIDADFFGGKSIKISNGVLKDYFSNGDCESVTFIRQQPADSLMDKAKIMLDSLVRNR